ncbi:XRE family transcriptional regulator [Streptomyces rhizosphaericus]|uniref:XRE family transcriptional regulator n=1 Tax=Streptomyces rhizosphaericus TaxID=114699 RepID=UPI00117EB0FC|nr:XRE family transcriptional regulator [Streptomyces rhizosphaericus]
MSPEQSAPQEASSPDFSKKARELRQAIRDRLRHIRANHPDGKITLDVLAERSNIAKRTLASAESEDGANLTIETLAKITSSLGIERPAYFLDDKVFAEVNEELALLKQLKDGNVSSVALRTSQASDIPASARAQLHQALMGIVNSVKVASDQLDSLSETPNSEDDTGQR